MNYLMVVILNVVLVHYSERDVYYWPENEIKTEKVLLFLTTDKLDFLPGDNACFQFDEIGPYNLCGEVSSVSGFLGASYVKVNVD